MRDTSYVLKGDNSVIPITDNYKSEATKLAPTPHNPANQSGTSLTAGNVSEKAGNF